MADSPPTDRETHEERSIFPRAGFLGATAAALAAATVPAATSARSAEALSAAEIAPAAPHQTAFRRRDETFKRRVACAAAQRDAFRASHGNGDEARYADAFFVGNFTKGLPHDQNGRVDPKAYRSLMTALSAGNPGALDHRASKRLKRLVAEAASIGADVAGADPEGLFVAPAPRLGSARMAAEVVELYWLALTRDIPYADYPHDAHIARACADLSRFRAADAPRAGGAITPATLFRGRGGSLIGPYLSQFLWLDVPQELDGPSAQRRATAAPGVDFVTDRPTWLAIQNGTIGYKQTPRAAAPRYLITGRYLTDYLEKIRSGIAWEGAAAIIAGLGSKAAGDLDIDDFHTLFGLAQNVSGNAMFYQKIHVQRRARPDAIGGLVALGRGGAPFHESLWSSPALDLVRERQGSLLLPQAYTYGTPPHPSYPAGHATLAGAGATILKALVNEKFVIEKPVLPNADGSRLAGYTGSPLTVGGELDKLAANCAYGRGTAGVHYRSDSDAGLLLGEAAAISILRDRAACAERSSSGYRFTRFNGEPIEIKAGIG